jgi:hypothetical protein
MTWAEKVRYNTKLLPQDLQFCLQQQALLDVVLTCCAVPSRHNTRSWDQLTIVAVVAVSGVSLVAVALAAGIP